jgi:hypothetical protein
MTYSVGGLIQAADYNTFQQNLNIIWGPGSQDSGWGQALLSAVNVDGVVAATNWASLVNTLTTAGNQTATTLTSRTAPVSGNVIAILANVATDISNVTTRRGFATSSGTISGTWTGNISKTTQTLNVFGPWTITWNHDVTFPSADAARYFWNAGGIVRLDMSKTSTGQDMDADWNTFVSEVGVLYLTGRVNNATQAIAGINYTGFTRIGGVITPIPPNPNQTTTGWYQIPYNPATPSTDYTLFQLNNSVSPYTSSYIRLEVRKVAIGAPDALRGLRFTTTWFQSDQGTTATRISGGTATTSPYTTFGTAPTVMCRVIPPSIAQGLTDTWGTPVIDTGVSA